MPDQIRLEDLRIESRERTLVHDVDLQLEPGWIVALVGPSGSGKTLTARALLGLVDLDPGVVCARLEVEHGDAVQRPYDGVLGGDHRARDRAFAAIRGRVISYLPQDARAALDPLRTVGHQVRAAARAGAQREDHHRPWLLRAGLPDPERVAALYPHELSGGMAQRVVIAQSLAVGSRYLIADEPTSALDPTVAVHVVDALRATALAGVGVLLITHDLRLLPELANEVAIFDAGTIVERARPDDLRRGLVHTPSAKRMLDATRRIAAGGLG